MAREVCNLETGPRVQQVTIYEGKCMGRVYGKHGQLCYSPAH